MSAHKNACSAKADRMRELDALRNRYDRKKETPVAIQAEEEAEEEEEETVPVVTQTKIDEEISDEEVSDEYITNSKPPVNDNDEYILKH